MLGRGCCRQEQRVRSDQLLDRPRLLPVDGTSFHLVAFTAEDQRSPALGVAVRPLLDHMLVIEDETVLMSDTIEHKIDFEPRGLRACISIEHEGTPWDLPFGVPQAEGVKHVAAHVIHRLEQIALARAIRTEDPSDSEHVERSTSLSPRNGTDELSFSNGSGEQRELQLVTEGSDVLGSKSEEH